MGRQVFTAGEILTAASMNDLGDATVMVFDDDAARATAIPTPVEGMVTYLKDTDLVEAFTGAAFVPVSQPGILQVVQGIKTDIEAVSVAGGATATLSGFSVTITPSFANSKILVFLDLNGSHDSTGGFFVTLLRNGSGISTGDVAGSRIRVTTNSIVNTSAQAISGSSAMVLDSPATTSAVTYTVEVLNGSGDARIIRINHGTDNADTGRIGRSASRIVCMEVAG